MPFSLHLLRILTVILLTSKRSTFGIVLCVTACDVCLSCMTFHFNIVFRSIHIVTTAFLHLIAEEYSFALIFGYKSFSQSKCIYLIRLTQNQKTYLPPKEEVDFCTKVKICQGQVSSWKKTRRHTFGLGEKKIMRLELKVSLANHSQIGQGI